MNIRAAVVAGAVLAVGVGGVAVAGTLSAPGVDACYRTTTGALRVDTGGGCRVGEQAIRLGTGQLRTRQVIAEGAVEGGQYRTATAWCGPGEVVTGGGVEVAAIAPDYTVFSDVPIEEAGLQGWQGAVSRPYADPEQVVAFSVVAICAPGESLD